MRTGHLRVVLRALILVALALCGPGVLGPSRVHAAPPGALRLAPTAAEVRTGTTSLEQASSTGDAAPATRSAPRDVPHFEGALPQLPAAPASHSVHSGGWIRFSYHPSMRAEVQPLIEQADSIRAELRQRLGQSALSKVVAHVARTPGEMATLAPEGAPFPKYAAGVAYPQLGLVLLTVAPVHPNSHHDLIEVFKHELAHIALHEAVLGRAVPRWFNEGFAVFASGESSLTRLQSLWTATVSDTLIPLERLERSFPADDVTASVAYAQAVDVVRFLVRKQESERFVALIERIRAGQSFDSALRDSYGTDLATLEFEWREEVSRRYTFWPILFSGSVIWAGVLGLFVWGWRRRRRRNRETLARWAKEEAAEEQKRREELVPPRLHIVFARPSLAQRGLPERRPPVSEVEIPKVEHEGQWHTLH